jgi:hypothetical protein
MSLQEHLPLILIEPGLLVPWEIVDEEHDISTQIESLLTWIGHLVEDDSKWVTWCSTEKYLSILDLLFLPDATRAVVNPEIVEKVRHQANATNLAKVIIDALTQRTRTVSAMGFRSSPLCVTVENPFEYAQETLQGISDEVVTWVCSFKKDHEEFRELINLVAYKNAEVPCGLKSSDQPVRTISDWESLLARLKGPELFRIALEEGDEEKIKRAVMLYRGREGKPKSTKRYAFGPDFVDSCAGIIEDPVVVGYLLGRIAGVLDLAHESKPTGFRNELVKRLKNKKRSWDGARAWHARLPGVHRLNYWRTPEDCVEFANVEFKGRDDETYIKYGDPRKGCGKQSRSMKKGKK